MPADEAKSRQTDREIRLRFGERVRALRVERTGLSQDKFALEAGIHRTWISAIERGTRAPSLGSICTLAKVLGVTPSELLEGIEAK